MAFEYANQLVSRGHEVTLVHPRRIKGVPAATASGFYPWLRGKVFDFRNLIATPKVDWQPIDERVRLLFVPNSECRHIPDADAIFATACFTANSVLRYPKAKGEKFYLIQHYETWMRPKDFVDATWRAPLHKVVISKWLFELGQQLGVCDLTYIPNAIDHERYKCIRPIEGRSRQIAMMFSPVPFKGAGDGIKALEIVRREFPDLKVVFFGIGRRQSWIPKWIEYYKNPEQNFIIAEIYNKSSIFLSPSLSEGFALPPAEAACCGCAVVASDSGGIQEYVQDGTTGLLSAPKDPVALAKNLCRLLRDEPLRAKLAIACQSQLKQFTWDKSAALLERFMMGHIRPAPSL